MKEKAHASIMLTFPKKWGKKGRKEIALWMRRSAEFLVKEGHKMSNNFKFHYISAAKKKRR